MPHRPQMLQTARGWYDKWVRGERASANDGMERVVSSEDRHMQFEEGGSDKVEAYAEPVKIEDVVEVKETTKDMADRVEALEFAGMAQAETLKNLTEQSQTLTRSLSDLQTDLHAKLDAVDQRLRDALADAESHRATTEDLEVRMQKISGDFSRLASRVNMVMGVSVIALLASAFSIGLVLMR